MPDPSAFNRGAMLVNSVNSSKVMGGIVKPSPKYKGFSVEIRPPKWEKKIWIGKLKTSELQKYAADALYHYLGMPLFHSEEGVMKLPPITCIGTVNGTHVELSTKESCANYVSVIAKGEVFKPQRDDFKNKVIDVVRDPAFPFLRTPRSEVFVLDDNDDSDREDEVEYDEDAAKALQMSSHSGSGVLPVPVLQTHVARPECGGGPEAVQAYVPSFAFDSNDSENTLRSDRESFSAIVFSPDDCPTTSSEDVKLWIGSIEELDKLTAAGTSTPSGASNDGEVCGDGYETSPIFDMPLIERPCAPTSPKFFGTPVERAVPVATALGSSSEWPSSQSAMKRRRITERR